MTDKHTPGPWVVLKLHADDHYGNWRITSERDGHDVASLVPNGKNSERCEANARLIAAAPDLLAELKALLPLASIHRSRQDCDRIRAAIANAEGK